MLKNISQVRKLDRARLPCLRKVEKGAALVTKVIKKTKRKGEKKQLSWKERLENQVKQLKKELRRLNALLEGQKMKKNYQDY